MLNSCFFKVTSQVAQLIERQGSILICNPFCSRRATKINASSSRVVCNTAHELFWASVYFPPSYTIFPPCYAIFFFFPPLRSLLCFRRKNSVTGGKNTNTNLQHKTNPELRYFGSYTIFK